MFLLKQVLPSALLAMMVAAAICGLALLCRNAGARAALVAFALALGYAAGHFLITDFTKVPPVDTTNWLPYLGIGGALGVLAGRGVPFQSLRWLFHGLIATCALRLLLAPVFRNTWSAGVGWIWVIFLAGATVLLAVGWDAVRRSAYLRIEVPLGLLVVSAGTAGALILAGSLLLGQFAIVLAGAIAGGTIVYLRAGDADGGAVAVPTLLLGALLVSGYFFAELPPLCAALLVVAPVFAIIPSRMAPSSLRVVVRLALVCAPVAAALILAFRSSPPLDY